MCPVRNVIARFGNKWSILVILLLNDNGATRFNVLSKKIPDISTKVLSGTLKTLEADGLVERHAYPEVPVRVEYTLTPTGQSLIPIILDLTRWALDNMKSVMAHRKNFEVGR